MKLKLLFLSAILLFLSCEKDQKDELEGKWQLKEVTYSDGTTHAVDTVWYNFMNTLFMIQLYAPSLGEDGEYHHRHGLRNWEDDKTLFIELTDPEPVEDFLPLTDWTKRTRSFTVEKVTGSKLILSSEDKTYSFRKF
ncbi:lipocalin-like domain-containing protein [Parabacteroides sp. OttesenSCG-928-G07]|nr:lipocalin-like domain-containing protein [Parabacteroides sp. OttesenSCG-928-G07]